MPIPAKNGYRDAIEAVVALFDVQREALSGHGSDVLEEFQWIDDRGGRAAGKRAPRDHGLVVDLTALLRRQSEQHLAQRRAVDRETLADSGRRENRLRKDLRIDVNHLEGGHQREIPPVPTRSVARDSVYRTEPRGGVARVAKHESEFSRMHRPLQ